MPPKNQFDVPPEWDLVPKDVSEGGVEISPDTSGEGAPMVIDTSIVEENQRDQETAIAEKATDLVRAEVLSGELRSTMEAQVAESSGMTTKSSTESQVNDPTPQDESFGNSLVELQQFDPSLTAESSVRDLERALSVKEVRNKGMRDKIKNTTLAIGGLTGAATFGTTAAFGAAGFLTGGAAVLGVGIIGGGAWLAKKGYDAFNSRKIRRNLKMDNP